MAQALVELTELREAFGEGQFGWSALKAITRVASVASQGSWLDFARQNGVERTLAEARDAQRRGRDKPRDSSFGLPNLDQKLVLRFSRSDMEKVRAWIECTCARVAEKTGTDGITVEQAILFLCESAMTSPAVLDRPAVGSSQPRAQLVYQRCPDCRRACVATREGQVEVTPAEVERYEGCADPVVIDGPTPPRLRRQVLAREGGRCGNPRCGNQADHCRHIAFRCRGGKTELANEVAVCVTCHALVHAGLLRVTGDAGDEPCWSPVVVADSLEHRVAADRVLAERLHSEVLPEHNNDGGTAMGGAESANADSVLEPGPAAGAGAAACDLDVDGLTRGLMRLGLPASQSRRAIDAAIATLPRNALTEAGVLRRALASI